MTETPAPYHAEPAPDAESLEIPDTPRITPGNIEAITIPAGSGTLAHYTLKNGERYARIEDLTPEEQAAALAFLLRHTPPQTIYRPHRAAALHPGELPEFDTAPLAALLDDNPKGETPNEKE